MATKKKKKPNPEHRIKISGNPWPDGHEIEDFDWRGRIEEDGVWFDLRLESEDYDARDDEVDDDEEEDEDDEKGLWTNYGSCTLSSVDWDDQTGFLVGTRKKPLDFAKLDGRTFRVDPLPVDFDEPLSFGIYMLGHDTPADHRIRFTKRPGGYAIHWKGKVAQTYVGSTSVDNAFDAKIQLAKFQGFRVPDNLDIKSARALLAEFVVGGERFTASHKIFGETYLIEGRATGSKSSKKKSAARKKKK